MSKQKKMPKCCIVAVLLTANCQPVLSEGFRQTGVTAYQARKHYRWNAKKSDDSTHEIKVRQAVGDGWVFNGNADNHGRPLVAGASIPSGSLVKLGPRSWGELRWQKVTIRLWQNTIIRIDPDKHILGLQEGALTFNQSKHNAIYESYELRSPRRRFIVERGTVHLIAQGNCEKFSALDGEATEISGSEPGRIHTPLDLLADELNSGLR